MLFFVEGKIRKTDFVGEINNFTHRGLVEAIDLNEACIKYEQYWIAKNGIGGNTYFIESYDINEPII